jgi:hypothetical protein
VLIEFCKCVSFEGFLGFYWIFRVFQSFIGFRVFWVPFKFFQIFFRFRVFRVLGAPAGEK